MFSNHKPLDRQVVVITGASSGIGLTTAKSAAAQGAKVVLASRNAEALGRVVAEITDLGGQAIAMPADTGRRADVQAVADAAVAAFGGVDTWVNNAGMTIYGRLEEVSDADHERLVQTNLWGYVYGSLVAVSVLRAHGGALVNVGSIASDIAFPLQGMYCATKHAVRGFTDALRMELEEDGAPISVSLIKPASIDTPLPQHARNYLDHEPDLPPPVYPPEEVAAAILHAATHPVRDLYVGGGGRAFTLLGAAAPSLYDRLSPAIMALQQRAESPREPAGGLHASNTTAETRGSHPGYVQRRSFYTRASMHPATTIAGAVGLGLTAWGLLRRAGARSKS